MSKELAKYRGNEDSVLPYHNSLFSEFDSIIQGALNEFWKSPSWAFSRNWKPTEVEESDNDYTISVEIPGFKKSEISVRAENDSLRIEAKNAKSSYSRLFSGYHWDLSKSDVTLENGILSVKVPKKEWAKAKSLEIKEIKEIEDKK